MNVYPRQELFEEPIVTLKDVYPDWNGDLNLKYDLNLYNTQIQELPDNLRVGGDLDLEKTLVTKLPNGLRVGDDLNLRHTQITELPDNLAVGCYIYFEVGKKLNYIPEHLKNKIVYA